MDINLKQIYEEIADEFDTTRYSVWTCVKEFLNNLPINSKCLEIGCGNGKNLLFRPELNMEGIDFCKNFVKICCNKGLRVKQNDMRNLDYVNDSFDNTFSVAVLHHLYKKTDRTKAIKEQIRVTKKGGLINKTIR